MNSSTKWWFVVWCGYQFVYRLSSSTCECGASAWICKFCTNIFTVTEQSFCKHYYVLHCEVMCWEKYGKNWSLLSLWNRTVTAVSEFSVEGEQRYFRKYWVFAFWVTRNEVDQQCCVITITVCWEEDLKLHCHYGCILHLILFMHCSYWG